MVSLADIKQAFLVENLRATRYNNFKTILFCPKFIGLFKKNGYPGVPEHIRILSGL